MRKLSPHIGLVLLVAFACPAKGQDWPKWLGPRADGISKETNILDRWPDAGPKRLWNIEVGQGFATPIAVKDRLYILTQVGNEEILRALNPATGKEIWKQTSPTKWKHSSYFGSRASPIIEGDRLYTFGGGGDLYCRELDGGKEIWHVNPVLDNGHEVPEWGCASNPLIVGDVMYLSGSENGPAAFAVDKKTGKTLWQSQFTGLPGYANHLLVESKSVKTLVVFAGEKIVGMDPADGKTRWSFQHRNRWHVNCATPLHKDGHVFITSDYEIGGVMLQLDGAAAKELWRNDKYRSQFTPPLLDDEFVYINDIGTIKCFAWPDGKLAWACEDRKLSLGKGGSILRVGDKLITYSESGTLSLSTATPKGISLISQFVVDRGSQLWTVPLLYNGRLYVKTTERLICYDVRKPE